MTRAHLAGAIAAAFFFFGCSSASFDLAGDDDAGDELGDVPEADAGAQDSHPSDDVDAGADVPRELGVDSADAGGADTVDSGTILETSTEAAGDTAPDGCALYDHYDPFSGKHFSSCLPAATPCDSSSYGSALFDEEMKFVEDYVATSMPTCSLTDPIVEIGGCDDVDGAVSNCVERHLHCGESSTCLVWCYEGSLAGGFNTHPSTCSCVPRTCDGRWY